MPCSSKSLHWTFAHATYDQQLDWHTLDTCLVFLLFLNSYGWVRLLIVGPLSLCHLTSWLSEMLSCCMLSLLPHPADENLPGIYTIERCDDAHASFSNCMVKQICYKRCFHCSHRTGPLYVCVCVCVCVCVLHEQKQGVCFLFFVLFYRKF